MKACDKEKCICGTLTLNDLDVTQGQSQNYQISLFRPLKLLRNILMAI